ncbi:hypothetical protein K438DRAFT_251554 [Mycena galopus ATCC 62051]|nr:hypothetical protein K438DRAFT_251554 [Mycena galopus ATCC 62051]
MQYATRIIYLSSIFDVFLCLKSSGFVFLSETRGTERHPMSSISIREQILHCDLRNSPCSYHIAGIAAKGFSWSVLRRPHFGCLTTSRSLRCFVLKIHQTKSKTNHILFLQGSVSEDNLRKKMCTLGSRDCFVLTGNQKKWSPEPGTNGRISVVFFNGQKKAHTRNEGDCEAQFSNSSSSFFVSWRLHGNSASSSIEEEVSLAQLE